MESVLEVYMKRQIFSSVFGLLTLVSFVACSGIKVHEGERSGVTFSEANLEITSPDEGNVVENDQKASVELNVSGFSLKQETDGYKEKGLAFSGKGQHIHVILDDKPYNAIYDLSDPVSLGKLEPGAHVVQAFPARQWHESVKSKGAFAFTQFYVGKKGNQITDPDKPFLVYSRPKGTYSGDGAEKVMVDFYVRNCQLGPDNYKVRLSINGMHKKTITEWTPQFVTGLKPGTHTFQLTLINPDGEVVQNGFNPITRKIRVKK